MGLILSRENDAGLNGSNLELKNGAGLNHSNIIINRAGLPRHSDLSWFKPGQNPLFSIDHFSLIATVIDTSVQ